MVGRRGREELFTLPLEEAASAGLHVYGGITNKQREDDDVNTRQMMRAYHAYSALSKASHWPERIAPLASASAPLVTTVSIHNLNLRTRLARVSYSFELRE